MNINYDSALKITFPDANEALKNTQGWGGWFFIKSTPTEVVLAGGNSELYTDKDVTWYNAKYYTESAIFRDQKGSGMIAGYTYLKNILKPI